jgi:hypothetical protein
MDARRRLSFEDGVIGTIIYGADMAILSGLDEESMEWY